jgi:hypothetical protein
MNARLDALARDRELLLMRSALCRLRLQRGALELRTMNPWNRVAIAAATAPPMRHAAFDIVVSFIGINRAAQWLALAGRAVLIAKLARTFIHSLHRAR